jgi:hypothetical protein
MAMPASVPAALTTGPFRGSHGVRRGLLTRRQLESAPWRRLFKDVYVHESVELSHLTRCRAVALILPAGAAVSGTSAAYLLGADIVRPGAPVEVTVRRELRMPGHPGVVTSYSEIAPGDVVFPYRVPATNAVRTAFDLARGRCLEDAVVGVDALIHACGVTIEAITGYASDGRCRWHGVRRLAQVLALAAPGAESPMETRLRLALIRAGLPMPTLQHHVWDRGGALVAKLDLAYVNQRLGVEYDGECHLDPEVVRKDLRRQNALRALGWTLLRFTADDVLRNPTRMVTQVCAAAGLPYPGHLIRAG